MLRDQIKPNHVVSDEVDLGTYIVGSLNKTNTVRLRFKNLHNKNIFIGTFKLRASYNVNINLDSRFQHPYGDYEFYFVLGNTYNGNNGDRSFSIGLKSTIGLLEFAVSASMESDSTLVMDLMFIGADTDYNTGGHIICTTDYSYHINRTGELSFNISESLIDIKSIKLEYDDKFVPLQKGFVFRTYVTKTGLTSSSYTSIVNRNSVYEPAFYLHKHAHTLRAHKSIIIPKTINIIKIAGTYLYTKTNPSFSLPEVWSYTGTLPTVDTPIEMYYALTDGSKFSVWSHDMYIIYDGEDELFKYYHLVGTDVNSSQPSEEYNSDLSDNTITIIGFDFTYNPFIQKKKL